MTYREFTENQSKEFSKFPIGWAFGQEQLEEVIQKIGKGKKENLISIGYGGLIHKDNKQAYLDLEKKLYEDRQKFLDNKDNLIDAIEEEMGQHEYIITYNDMDVILALGISKEKQETKVFQDAFKEAKKRYLDWYKRNGY